ncbi:unnamed protein product [Brassica oleracea var. botrytis]
MQRCPLFMSLFRVFIDNDMPPTIEYLSWLAQNQDVSAMVNAFEVTGQDANHSDCQTKVNRGLASLRCPKCGNVSATEVVRLAFLILTFLHRLSFHSKSSALQYMYLSEILAYDKDEKATLYYLVMLVLSS